MRNPQCVGTHLWHRVFLTNEGERSLEHWFLLHWNHWAKFQTIIYKTIQYCLYSLYSNLHAWVTKTIPVWEKSSQHANHKIQHIFQKSPISVFFLRAPSADRMELGWPLMESKVHGMRLGWCKDWLDDSRMMALMGTTAQGSETWAAHVFVFFF